MPVRWMQTVRSLRTFTVPILFLFWAATNAYGCPICTYDRMLAQNWHLKHVLISLLVPLFVVANRLDVVRMLFILIPYAAFDFEFHSCLFWHTFPADTFLAKVGWWTWGLNLVGIGLLYGVSRLKFFRWNKEKGLAFWQPIAYAGLAFFANIIAR